jgi:hypothetical protein
MGYRIVKIRDIQLQRKLVARSQLHSSLCKSIPEGFGVKQRPIPTLKPIAKDGLFLQGTATRLDPHAICKN